MITYIKSRRAGKKGFYGNIHQKGKKKKKIRLVGLDLGFDFGLGHSLDHDLGFGHSLDLGHSLGLGLGGMLGKSMSVSGRVRTFAEERDELKGKRSASAGYRANLI